MRRCENGHDVLDGQKFCGECGVQIADTGSSPPAPEAANDSTYGPDSGAAVDGESVAVDDPLGRRRWGVLAIGGLVLMGLVAVLAVSLAPSDDHDERAEVAVATTEPPTGADLCVDDLDRILADATLPGSTADSTAQDVMAVYGLQDDRTRFLLQENATFQAEVFQVGSDNANTQSQIRVRAFCEQRADEFGY